MYCSSIVDGNSNVALDKYEGYALFMLIDVGGRVRTRSKHVGVFPGKEQGDRHLLYFYEFEKSRKSRSGSKVV